jgi:predicted SAM-dependent methyltransferase
MKTFLHVGCGQNRKERTTVGLNTSDWREIRLDIDASVSPDVTGSMTDMSAVSSASMDALFSSHNIEHLYAHEVPLALSEFLRVLNDEGFAVITCPDLQSVARLVAEDRLLEPAYNSPAGPIAPLDILYGFRPSMARGNLYMAHRCGFTQKVLHGTLLSAGFKSVATMCRGRAPFFDLWTVASKSELADDKLKVLAGQHFPR